MGVRQDIADAHGVSEVTVRAWANGTRKHPCSLSAFEITESVTGGRVLRHELRPDIFGHGENNKEQDRAGEGGRFSP